MTEITKKYIFIDRNAVKEVTEMCNVFIVRFNAWVLNPEIDVNEATGPHTFWLQAYRPQDAVAKAQACVGHQISPKESLTSVISVQKADSAEGVTELLSCLSNGEDNLQFVPFPDGSYKLIGKI